MVVVMVMMVGCDVAGGDCNLTVIIDGLSSRSGSILAAMMAMMVVMMLVVMLVVVTVRWL